LSDGGLVQANQEKQPAGNVARAGGKLNLFVFFGRFAVNPRENTPQEKAKNPTKTAFQTVVGNYLKESCIWHLAKSNGYTILCLSQVNKLGIVSFLLANFWAFSAQKIVGKKLGFLLDHR